MDGVYYKKYPSSSSRDSHPSLVHAAHHSHQSSAGTYGSLLTGNSVGSNRARTLIPSVGLPIVGRGGPPSSSLDYGPGSGGHRDYPSGMMEHQSIYTPSQSQTSPMGVPINVVSAPQDYSHYSHIVDHHSSGMVPSASAPATATAPNMSSSLEKYFTPEELKRFNEYNRFFVMSSPGRQKKFYASLTSGEYKRFNDYLNMESQAKSLLPPPIIPAAPSSSIVSSNNQALISVKPQEPFIQQISTKQSFISSTYSYDSQSSSSYYGNCNSNESIGTGNVNSNNHYQRNTGKYAAPSPQISESSDYYARPGIGDYPQESMPPIRGMTNSYHNYEENESIRYVKTPTVTYPPPPMNPGELGTSDPHSRNTSNSQSRSRTPNRYGKSSSHRESLFSSPLLQESSDGSYHLSTSDSRKTLLPTPVGKKSASKETYPPKRTSSTDKPSSKSESSSKTRRSHSYDKNFSFKENEVKILEERIKQLEKRLERDRHQLEDRRRGRSRSSERSSSTSKKRSRDQKTAASSKHSEIKTDINISGPERSKKAKIAEKLKSSANECSKNLNDFIATSKKNVQNQKNKPKEESKSSSLIKKQDSITKDDIKTTEKTSKKDSKNSKESKPDLELPTKTLDDEKTAEMKNYKIPKKGSAAPTTPTSKTKSTTSLPKSTSSTIFIDKSSTWIATNILTSKTKASPDETSGQVKKHSKTLIHKHISSSSKTKTKSTNSGSNRLRESNSPFSKHHRAPSQPHTSYPYRLTDEEFEKALPQFQWCNMCHLFFESSLEYLKHIHCDRHFSRLGTSDFHIIKKAEDKINSSEQVDQLPLKHSNSTLSANSESSSSVVDCDKEQFLGTEFLYPLISFYCDLCSKFLSTTQQGQEHLRSERHLTLYRKYTKKNVDFYKKFNEKRMDEFRQSPYARQLLRDKQHQIQRLKQDDTSSLLSGNNDNRGKIVESKSTIKQNIDINVEIKQILDSILDRIVKNHSENKNQTSSLETKKSTTTTYDKLKKQLSNKELSKVELKKSFSVTMMVIPTKKSSQQNSQSTIKEQESSQLKSLADTGIKRKIEDENDMIDTMGSSNRNQNKESLGPNLRKKPAPAIQETIPTFITTTSVANKKSPNNTNSKKTNHNKNIATALTGVTGPQKKVNNAAVSKKQASRLSTNAISIDDNEDGGSTTNTTTITEESPLTTMKYTKRRAAAAVAASIISQQSKLVMSKTKQSKKLLTISSDSTGTKDLADNSTIKNITATGDGSYQLDSNKYTINTIEDEGLKKPKTSTKATGEDTILKNIKELEDSTDEEEAVLSYVDGDKSKDDQEPGPETEDEDEGFDVIDECL